MAFRMHAIAASDEDALSMAADRLRPWHRWPNLRRRQLKTLNYGRQLAIQSLQAVGPEVRRRCCCWMPKLRCRKGGGGTVPRWTWWARQTQHNICLCCNHGFQIGRGTEWAQMKNDIL
eukprot:s2601_g6.t1